MKITLQPLLDIHNDGSFEAEYADVRDIKFVYTYSMIAFFILLIACINFMKRTKTNTGGVSGSG